MRPRPLRQKGGGATLEKMAMTNTLLVSGLKPESLDVQLTGLCSPFTLRKFRLFAAQKLGLDDGQAWALLLFLYEQGHVSKNGFARFRIKDVASGLQAPRTPGVAVGVTEAAGLFRPQKQESLADRATVRLNVSEAKPEPSVCPASRGWLK